MLSQSAAEPHVIGITVEEPAPELRADPKTLAHDIGSVHELYDSRDSKAGVKLECEEVLASQPADGIHEGRITLETGFVPNQPFAKSLPPEFKILDDVQRDLKQILTEGRERLVADALPLLDVGNLEKLPNKYLSRASQILANIVHGYYYNQRYGMTQAEDPLPENLKKMWEIVNARLGRRFIKDFRSDVAAQRTLYDLFLCNFEFTDPDFILDGENNLDLEAKDIRILNDVTPCAAETGNAMQFAMAEIKFAPALKHIIQAVKSVASEDEAGYIAAMKNISMVLNKVADSMIILNPNEYSETYTDPTEWAKTVAKYDGRIPGGYDGLSGSQFPMFHVMDEFIERDSYESKFGKDFKKKFDMHPQHTADFISALAKDVRRNSLRTFAEKSKNPRVKAAYKAMLDTYQYFLHLHKLRATCYLGVNFSLGRLETNGGNTGSALTQSEAHLDIYDRFEEADAARLGNFEFPSFAVPVSKFTYGDSAFEAVYDVSQTGFDFLPGDRVSVYPENSDEAIASFLGKHALDAKQVIELNPQWNRYLRSQLGQDLKHMEVATLLKYVDLTEITHVEGGLSIDKLLPIKPRNYSVSPEGDRIRLIVGRHFYQTPAGKQEGLASGYLFRNSGPIRVKRTPGRFFRLPADPRVPVIVIGQGTGASPLTGILDARSKQKGGGKNYAYFGWKDRASYLHREGLEQHARDGKLNLNVIFSREEPNTTVYDADSKTFKDTRIDGRHVDALLDRDAKEIARLIKEEGAHVFVCGTSDFENTVNKSLERALAGSTPDPKTYIKHMKGRLRYKTDVFTQYKPGVHYRPIFRSEVTYHNKRHDCWFTINGKVYDLTDFLDVHKGGHKFPLLDAGLNVSNAFNKIKHAQDQQILATMEQYCVGKIVEPTFGNTEARECYQRWFNVMDGLVKMENILWINTSLVTENPPVYLWREVLSVMFDGKLQSARTETDTGPFKFLMVNMVKELYTLSGLPMPDYTKELERVSRCGIFVRDASLGPLTSAQLENVQHAYDFIINGSFRLINDMKASVLKAIREMESNPDGFDPKTFAAHLKQIENDFKQFMVGIDQIHKVLGLDKPKPGRRLFEAPLAVCPVPHRLRRGDRMPHGLPGQPAVVAQARVPAEEKGGLSASVPHAHAEPLTPRTIESAKARARRAALGFLSPPPPSVGVAVAVEKTQESAPLRAVTAKDVYGIHAEFVPIVLGQPAVSEQERAQAQLRIV